MTDNFLMIATGAMGHGKSEETLKDLLFVAYSDKAPRNRNALIIDTNNEFGVKRLGNGKTIKIKTIQKEEIVAFNNNPQPQVRRIVIPQNVDEEKFVISVLNSFRGGICLLDDINNIWFGNIPKKLVKTIISVRHRMQLVFHQQTIAKCNPTMWQNTMWIRYHYQFDSVRQSANKITGSLELFEIAEKLVNKVHSKCHCPRNKCSCGNRYFYVFIDRMFKRICGKFTKLDFQKSVREYIAENPRILKQKLNAGTKHNIAVAECINELTNKYYGN